MSDSAESYYGEAEVFASALTSTLDDDVSLAYLIECRSKILKYKISQSDRPGAAEYYESTLEVISRSSDDLVSVKGLKWFGEVYMRLIEYHLCCGTRADADGCFSAIIGIAERCYQNEKAPDVMSNILGLYSGYGDLLDDAGDASDAKKYYKKAIDYFWDSEIFREEGFGDKYYFCLIDVILLCTKCGLACALDEYGSVDEFAERTLVIIKLFKKNSSVLKSSKKIH